MKETNVQNISDSEPAIVNRFEIIDRYGRSYINLDLSKVTISYQDKGKTLKIFID